MTHSSTRFFTASLFVLALSIFSTSVSFGALNSYLQLKGQKSGKSYKATPDANGKFSFKDVAPDTYTLYFVGGADATADKGHDKWIQLESISFGASNSGTSMGSGASGREASAPSVSEIVVTKRMDAASPGVTVAAGDVNGDGLAKNCAAGAHYKKVTLSMISSGGGEPTEVLVEGFQVSSNGSLDGAVKASWNLKENVK